MTESQSNPVSSFVRRALEALRRSLWVVALAAVVLFIAWFRFWSPVRVEVARVDRGTITEEAFGRGTIESQREAAVGFDLIGRLSEVLVEEGARVTLGQELARLETDQARADLRSAQTGIGAARAALQRLAAEEERARALVATAERETTRTQGLFETGAVTAQQRDDASDRLRVARADLDRVLAQRSEATRGIDVAAGGAEQRRVAMVRATLLSPFDGLVTRRLREPGDTVAIGSTVLRIVDTSRVYVNAAMDETVLPRLAVDQQSAIFFPGESTPVMGRVTRISWEADRQTHELLVEVTPDRLERRIAIGQRADVRVEVGRRERALRVPVRMIHHDDTGAFVYVNREGKLDLVRPRLGLTGREHVEVLEGLSEGDAVLAAPGSAVSLPVGRRWRAK
jgi:HlyD family secretion protein